MNEDVLDMVREERKLMENMKMSQKNWLGHTMRSE